MRQRIGRQRVGTECLFVEKNRRVQAKRSVQVFGYVLGIGRNINPQFFDQPLGHRAVRCRTLDGKGPAKAQHRPRAGAKLVALGVPAEVVVVVENQYAGFWSSRFAEEVSRRESADASAHNYKIVLLVGVDGRSGVVPEGAVTQAVGCIKRSRMTAAQAAQYG